MPNNVYVPGESKVRADPLAEFISLELDSNTPLTAIPGVGPANAKHFHAVGIFHPHQLIGQFLLMKVTDMTPEDHLSGFKEWCVATAGTTVSAASDVTFCISERAKTIMPGIFE